MTPRTIRALNADSPDLIARHFRAGIPSDTTDRVIFRPGFVSRCEARVSYLPVGPTALTGGSDLTVRTRDAPELRPGCSFYGASGA